VRWNLSVVLICISFMVRNGEHFFMCFLAIWISSFEKVLHSSVAHFWLVHWFWESLVFWVPCIFWLLVLCLMYNWQIFSSTLWVVYSVKRPFLLLCGSFLILCCPISPSFLLVAELLRFYWGSPCLYILLPEYSLIFPGLTSEFRVWY
jgi:hypothetical protein